MRILSRVSLKLTWMRILSRVSRILGWVASRILSWMSSHAPCSPV
jgi:hypothetical protein